MNAVPDRAKSDKSGAPLLSRLETMRRARGEEFWMPEMPPLEGAGYLLGYLWEVGPVMAGAMGAVPITHEELRAWQGNTGISLQPWEARFMRSLSIEYLNESRRAEKRDCPAPFRQPDAIPEVSDTQAAIRALANL